MPRAAVLHAPGDLRIQEVAAPSLGRGQVLVNVLAVGICGSDVHYYDHGQIGPYVVDDPMIIGHESAGVIAAVGEGVDESRIGELVALEPGVPCGSCAQCRVGRYNLCPDVLFFATPPVDGSIVESVAIDAAFAHTAPDTLSAEQAALAEPVSVGVAAARKGNVGLGDRVLVTGAGPIGLIAAQVARAAGATTVTVTDTSGFRLGVARELGFRTAPAGAELNGYDVLLECSGAAPAIRSGIAALAPAGRAVLIGMGADEVALDIPLIQGRELQLTGVFRYANTYPEALGLIASGAVEVGRLITHRFPLDRTEDALTIARRDGQSLKAVVILD